MGHSDPTYCQVWPLVDYIEHELNGNKSEFGRAIGRNRQNVNRMLKTADQWLVLVDTLGIKVVQVRVDVRLEK